MKRELPRSLFRPKKLLGYWEEYKCGCVSETVRTKKELLGYCKFHGEDRRHIHPDYTETAT